MQSHKQSFGSHARRGFEELASGGSARGQAGRSHYVDC